MIPENIRQHRPYNILFIGNTAEPYYSGHYYKAFKNLGHQVVSICPEGEIPIMGAFGFTEIKPALKKLGFQPDLVVVVECYPLIDQFNPANLHEELDIPVAFISIDSGLNYVKHAQMGSNYDYIFISDQDYLAYYTEHCLAKVVWLQYACDPEIHQTVAMKQSYDLAFAGRALTYPDFYRERLAYLQALPRICKFKSGEALSYQKTAQLYSSSRMIFNYALVNGVNARIYEALSFGKLLLTNRTTALQGVFADKVHLVFYDNLGHLTDLLKFYLKYPERRKKIAFQGQSKAWRHHTFYHRIDQLMRKIFQDRLYQL